MPGDDPALTPQNRNIFSTLIQQDIPPANPPPTTPPPTTASEPSLEGLRTFLATWDQAPRNAKFANEERNASKAVIYSTYTEHAAAEDKELVGRWTETLNILLTFAGLQSAIVTAFLLVLDPSLKPDNDDVADILRQILHRLDNSTVLPLDHTDAWAPPASAVHVSAWWYTSLACGLLSAFGALLSKQWVLHYQSELSWVNTPEGKAQLREARYQGLRIWQFFSVIESLSILLQLSLLFFVIGLVGYLHPISSTLFFVVMFFIMAGALFYLFTFICGMIFPSCPFKSPITTLALRMFAHGLLVSIMVPLTATARIAALFSWNPPSDPLLQTLLRWAGAFWEDNSAMHFGFFFHKLLGEAWNTGDNSAGAGGVLCWWLCEEGREERAQPQLTAHAVDTITSIPPQKYLNRFQTTEEFDNWCGRVGEKLDGLSEPQIAITPEQLSNLLQVTDAMCHFMYHSPTATRIAISGIENEPQEGLFRFCRAIRTAWAGADAIHEIVRGKRELGVLPIPTMRWTTVSVYLRIQLRDWCDKRRGGVDDRRYHDLIIQELPVLAQDLRPLKRVSDVASIISLAAIAFVDDDVPGVGNKEELTTSSPMERLLLALDRLSYYPSPGGLIAAQLQQEPPTHCPERLLPQLIHTVVTMLNDASQTWPQTSLRSVLLGCKTWKSGKFGGALLRLLDLGVLFRDCERLQSKPETGKEGQDQAKSSGELVQEVFSLLKAVLDCLIQPPFVNPDGLFELSLMPGIASVLNACARTTVDPKRSAPLAALQITLGTRFYNISPVSRSVLRGHRRVSLSPHPNNTLPLSLLIDNPPILSYLLQEAQQAAHPDTPDSAEEIRIQQRQVLSTVIKIRDLLFTPQFRQSSENQALLLDLDSLFETMYRSGSLLYWSSEVIQALDGFQRWDEVVQALGDLQKCLLADQETLDVTRAGSARVGDGSAWTRDLGL